MTRRLTVLLALAMVTASCISGDFSPGGESSTDTDPSDVVPSGCREVPTHVSSEKVTLLTALADQFNESGPEIDGECVAITVYRTASGRGASQLAEGWPGDESAGPPPVVWSPASSAWGAVVNQRLAEQGLEPLVGSARRIMLTPLVLAMPEPMAEALGWPETSIGWSDVLALANDEEGWGAFGHPEWGPFKLGKTNPNFSTSGLSATIAIYSAATGSTDRLEQSDIDDPEVIEFVRGVEAATVHYGDTTLTFLENMLREDLAGRPLSYASAVAVEEVSVIAYNRGDPADTGESDLPPPNVPLVAVYPEEGTLFSDNPAYVVDGDWVDDVDRQAAEAFIDFVIDDPDNQTRALEFGFRPGNPSVPIGDPITTANGLDPSQPETELVVPEPAVLSSLIASWEENRKPARVIMLLDVSGSMSQLGGDGFTKLDLAKQAVEGSLDEFKDDDEVGLWIFSYQENGPDHLELVPPGPLSTQRQAITDRLRGLIADGGTGLYDSTSAAVGTIRDSFDTSRINAVILLSDGVCDDDPGSCDIEPLLRQLSSNERDPVRVFAVAYGEDADVEALTRIAEASQARLYTATDPTTIVRVFQQVVSNF